MAAVLLFEMLIIIYFVNGLTQEHFYYGFKPLTSIVCFKMATCKH